MVSRRAFLKLLGGASVVDLTRGLTSDVEGFDQGADRLVGAHYYTWYGPDNHWDNGYTGTPQLGEYDSGDSKVIQQHVGWAETHGIDWFNATWWGPESYSGRTLENHVAPALAGTDVEFSVLYEPKGRFAYDDGVVDFDDQSNRDVLAADLNHVAASMVDNPNYLHVDGKPVLYVYIARTFTGNVVGAFEDAASRAGTEFYLVGDYGRTPQLPSAAFDAVSPYNMYRPVDDVNEGFADFVERAYRGWHLLAESADFDFVPLALPGFDNTEAEWATDGQPVLERSPERYRNLCEIARRYADADREMVLVTSFNEWHEYTSVEPAEAFGTTYLEITRSDLAEGASLSPSFDLVPLTFYWDDYVLESSVNPDLPEGSGRHLTLAIDQLRLLDSEGGVVQAYNFGATPEPLFTHGVSYPGAHENRTWRWLTADRLMETPVFVPSAVADATRSVEAVCRPPEDRFEFAVSLGESATPTSITTTQGWGTVARTLEGQVPESTTTEETSAIGTTTLHSTTPDRSSTETSSGGTTPGFGVGAGLTATAAATYAALRRRIEDPNDD